MQHPAANPLFSGLRTVALNLDPSGGIYDPVLSIRIISASVHVHLSAARHASVSSDGPHTGTIIEQVVSGLGSDRKSSVASTSVTTLPPSVPVSCLRVLNGAIRRRVSAQTVLA